MSSYYLFAVSFQSDHVFQVFHLVITLCMKEPWFRHTNSRQSFCNCLPFVIALVPDLFFGWKSAEGSKVVVTLLLPQMADNSDTLSSLLGKNELHQLSNKWRNKNIKYSTKLGLILIKLGQFNIRSMLIWRSICHMDLIKY